MARRPREVRGIKFRPDRGTWEAQYKANGSRVRKNFLDHESALVWLETAKVLSHKEGVASLPSSAAEPLLTLAEKKELKEHRANSLLLGELCDQYLAHLQNPNNPERPKDQVNPPQRLRAIKEAFGDRSAVSLEPHEIKDWLISLGRAAATLNRLQVHSLCRLHVCEGTEAGGVQCLPRRLALRRNTRPSSLDERCRRRQAPVGSWRGGLPRLLRITR